MKKSLAALFGLGLLVSAGAADAQMVNAQTGTSYTFVAGDCDPAGQKLVTFNNAASVAVTLPQAGASGQFLGGCTINVVNLGAGTVTITPTTSTINAAASQALGQYAGGQIFNDSTPASGGTGNYIFQSGLNSAGPVSTASITGTASTFPINGLAAAQGGSVTITGGTSSTSANAGGATALVGGTPGATGIGGAATVTGGAGLGGAAGGAATVTAGAGQGTGAGAIAGLVGGASGAGATGNGGISRVVGGAATSTNGSGGAGQLTGGAATGTGTGGAATITGGLGGATNAVGGAASLTAGAGQGTGAGAVSSVVGGASGAGATGNGGAASVTGGAAASTAGTGGAASLVGGAGTTTGAGGAIAVTGGAGGNAAAGGAVAIAAGASTGAAGAAVTITSGGGNAGTAAGGDISLVAGAAVSTGQPGLVKVNTDANLIYATYYFTGSPAATNQAFFIATRAMIVISCSEVHSTAAGGASTLTVEKNTGTAAPGSGTGIFQSGSFNLNATANTVQNASISTTIATAKLAAGDRLGVVFANAIQSSVGVVVSCGMAPL